MPWVKLDDGFAEHPKVVAAGDAAGWLYVAALCWSNRQQTDGRIPPSVVPRLTGLMEPLVLAERLVEVGLWEHLPAGGYRIHDYELYQGTREQREQNREQWRKKKAGQRLTSSNVGAAKCPQGDTPGTPGGGGGVVRSPLSLPGITADPSGVQAGGGGSGTDERARLVLQALNDARHRANPRAVGLRGTEPNMRHIRDRLMEGHSVEDCLHVIRVWEAEIGDADDGLLPKLRLWFDAVTPFRSDNFARKLARGVPEARGGEPEESIADVLRRARGGTT